MRIGLINQYAVPPTVAGGTRHWDLSTEWDAAGHEVRVVASSFNHFEQTADTRLPARSAIGERSALLTLDGGAYEGNGLGRVAGMLRFASRVLRYRHVLNEVDVVIGSSPQPFAAVAAAILARVRGIPFVLEIRDLWPQTLVDMGAMRTGSFPARFLYLVERRLVKAARGVVFLPPEGDRYLLERSIPVSRVLHVPNSAQPFDVPHGDPSVRTHDVLMRMDAWKESGVRVFSYAGTLGRANGLGAVIDAFRQSPVRDVAALVICGDGPERQELEARLPVRSNVLFVGHVPKMEAFRIVQQSDVALFHLIDAPVFQYGLSPNKLIDYLNVGKPILYAGPNVPNPTSGSGATVDAQPGNPEAIADAVETFVGMDDEQLAEMGSRAQAHAKEHYSSATVANKYLGLLEAVVSEAKAVSAEPSLPSTAKRSAGGLRKGDPR